MSSSKVESTRDSGICISNLVCPAVFIILALRSISPGCLDLIPDSLVVVCFVGSWVFCFFFFSVIYIFVSLDLLCMQAFSSCSKWGLLFIAVVSLVAENGL